MGVISMILPYIIVGIMLYLAWRWFKGRMVAGGKAVIKGGKAANKKDSDLRRAAMKGDKKAMAKYGATMLIPGVAPIRGIKAIRKKTKKKKGTPEA